MLVGCALPPRPLSFLAIDVPWDSAQYKLGKKVGVRGERGDRLAQETSNIKGNAVYFCLD